MQIRKSKDQMVKWILKPNEISTDRKSIIAKAKETDTHRKNEHMMIIGNVFSNLKHEFCNEEFRYISYKMQESQSIYEIETKPRKNQERQNRRRQRQGELENKRQIVREMKAKIIRLFQFIYAFAFAIAK